MTKAANTPPITKNGREKKNLLGIDITDTTWMLNPAYEPFPNAPWYERRAAWIMNHEWRVWLFIIAVLVFWL